MKPQSTVLQVGGLHWATSTAVVEHTLRRRPGVLAVEASAVSQTANVTYDPDRTNVARLSGWVRDCGYHCAGQSVPDHVCDPMAERPTGQLGASDDLPQNGDPSFASEPNTVIVYNSRARSASATDGGNLSAALCVTLGELQGIDFRDRPEEVLMKSLSIVALVGLPLLFTVACASPSHLVGVANAPGSSVDPTHSSAPASACENTNRHQGNAVVMVDWVDFVQLSGTQYIAGLDGQVPPVASAQLGAVVGRVRCQLSALKFSEMPGPNVDGDAAFLPIGTEVHAIDGFEPSCRVAARIDGANRMYLAHHNVGGYSKAVPCGKAP